MDIGRIAASVVVLALGLAPGAVAADEDPDVTLSVGQHAFWDGADIDQAAVASAEACNEPSHEASPCWEYTIEVRKEGGSRLRVGLSSLFREAGDVRDWPDFSTFGSEMIFRIELYDPKGVLVDDASTSQEFTQYATEVFAQNPDDGMWRVLVIPTSVRDLHFRMRAKLEGEQNHPPGILSPNLRTVPPFELNFKTAAASFNPAVPSDGTGCMAEENADALEEGYEMPDLCLRYSMGLENAGIGRFFLTGDGDKGCPLEENRFRCYLLQRRFAKVSTPPTCDETGINCRNTCLEDGTCVDDPSRGAYEKYHLNHGHAHFEQIWDFQLYAIDDAWRPGHPEPALTKEGRGRKLGLTPTNELMADWHRFYQADSDSIDLEGENPEKKKGGNYELPPGWGDAYEWNRGGNYSGITADPQGHPRRGYYLLLGTTDPHDLIIESNEDDNVSYSLIEIGADGPFDVELLERGYGNGPWDADKTVLTTSP